MDLNEDEQDKKIEQLKMNVREDKIPFLKIGELVEGIVDSEAWGGTYTLDDVYECDRMARAYVLAHV